MEQAPAATDAEQEAAFLLEGNTVLMNRVADLEAELSRLRPSRWIPCSERLPETSGHYMTTQVHGRTQKRDVAQCYFLGDCKPHLWGTSVDWFVTHWQPLPMPALSENGVAVCYATNNRNMPGLPGMSTSILFFDVQSGLSGGRRDLPRMERDVPQLVPLGDTLLVRTRASLEILK